MRGIHSVVDDLRRQVFTEVARLAYEGGDFSRIDALPYKIIPGETPCPTRSSPARTPSTATTSSSSAPSSPSASASPAACPCAPPPR